MLLKENYRILGKNVLQPQTKTWALTFDGAPVKVARAPEKEGRQHPHLGEVHPGGVGAQELALNVLLHPLQDAVLVQEVDLVLCGVHVHIHILGADF